MTKKKSVCCIWYLSNHISYDCHLWYTCVNNISRSFFHLFKILIFWIVSRVKGQKIAQNYKKNSVMTCSAWYIKNHTSWLPSLVHKCKIILSPGIFLFFQNFGFLGGEEGQRAKNGPKWQRLCPLHFISQEPYIIWPWFVVYICKRIMSAGVFYFFPNLNFLGQWAKEQKMA